MNVMNSGMEDGDQRKWMVDGGTVGQKQIVNKLHFTCRFVSKYHLSSFAI